MIIRQKWINRKTGLVREVALTEAQAEGHGFMKYEESKVAQVVKPLIAIKMPTEPVDKVLQELPDLNKEPENAALAPPTTQKPATKKPGRKPKTPKSE